MACTVTPKVFLGILTIIFWGAAGSLIFIGSWVYKEYEHYDELTEAIYTLIPATVLIAAGVFFFILGLIGCIGAFKEQKCLLGVYFTFLLFILVGLMLTAVLGYIYKHNIADVARDNLKKGFNDYGRNKSDVITDEIDFMQSRLKCCGMDNYTDWENTYWHEEHPELHYPSSCCPDKACHNNPYQQGCYKMMKDLFLGHLTIVGGVAASFAVVQIIGMVCACVLICKRRSDTPYIGLTSPEHMRV